MAACLATPIFGIAIGSGMTAAYTAASAVIPAAARGAGFGLLTTASLVGPGGEPDRQRAARRDEHPRGVRPRRRCACRAGRCRGPGDEPRIRVRRWRTPHRREDHFGRTRLLGNAVSRTRHANRHRRGSGACGGSALARTCAAASRRARRRVSDRHVVRAGGRSRRGAPCGDSSR